MDSAPRNGMISQETGRDMATPEPSVWREVGWIFCAGEILAIERSGQRTRRRELLG